MWPARGFVELDAKPAVGTPDVAALADMPKVALQVLTPGLTTNEPLVPQELEPLPEDWRALFDGPCTTLTSTTCPGQSSSTPSWP